MLVIKRKPNETLHLGNDITIRVLQANGSVRLGIEAPEGTKVLRGELLERAKEEQHAH